MKKRNFRQFIENNRWLKQVPNSLTICNSLCGFGAILYTLYVYDSVRTPENVLEISAWIIMFAMVFDMLDGFTARIFKAASMQGLQMDSLSDMTTFGVAPAVIVAVMAHVIRRHELATYQYLIVWAFCAVYIAGAALRLARYNVHAMLEKKSGEKFTGLPSPGAAAAVCSLVIFYSMKHGEIKQVVKFLPLYTGVLGILMISNIPYPHMGKWLLSVRRNKRRMLVVLAALIFAAIQLKLALVIAVNLYIISGPLVAFGIRLGILPPPPMHPVDPEDEPELTTE